MLYCYFTIWLSPCQAPMPGLLARFCLRLEAPPRPRRLFRPSHIWTTSNSCPHALGTNWRSFAPATGSGMIGGIPPISCPKTLSRWRSSPSQRCASSDVHSQRPSLTWRRICREAPESGLVGKRKPLAVTGRKLLLPGCRYRLPRSLACRRRRRAPPGRKDGVLPGGDLPRGDLPLVAGSPYTGLPLHRAMRGSQAPLLT